ncbi:MAG: HDOD domain-containing protein [Patescibacteria group bacterium]|nr:HDOD domain-containing protein [Patescibacteria group bacterium]
MNTAETALDRLAARATQLYSLPAVAMKVLELTNNPQVDTHALKKCIENDPALTSKLLRVVNSSLFGLSREVSDLNQALALLGSKPLKMLVLGFSLPPALFAKVEGNVLQHYWRHTLTKAVAGREISEMLWMVPGDDAFMAGLLQDLGELLLIQEIGEPYCKLLRKVEEGHYDLAMIEVETMGFDHTALSARILAGWGLPSVLVESIPWGDGLRPSDSAEGRRSPAQQILHLAELLASFLADGRPEALAELLIVGRHYREFSDEQLERLVESLEEKVTHLADVLSLDLPDGLNYGDVLLRAYRQLSVVAESAAISMLQGREEATPVSDEQLVLNELQDLGLAVSRIASPSAAWPEPQPVEVAVRPCAQDARLAPAARSVSARGSSAIEAKLLEHLTTSARACRNSRCPLSLVLIQFDPPVGQGFDPGTAGYDVLLRELECACRQLDHDCAICWPNAPGGFALVLPDCERRQAVEYGSQLARQFRRAVQGTDWAGRVPEGSVSVGAATVSLPPRNFPPAELYDAASRCMYASRSSGGVVKSIEIY